ncbi:MAG TPA: cell envelope integrity protein TolA [Candidatus Kryptonia bacterium]|nr:cell envelope integrity protein TolA [Candidatus Kryptonia bacterium]
MNTQSPLVLHHAEWDRGLFWMVLVSLAAHAGALALLVILPHHFTLRPRPQVAYVVDLVTSDQLAGTNLIPGSKAKVEAPPKVEPKPPPPPPPPPKVEEAKKPEPPPPPPKPEPQKVEPKPAVDDKAVKLAMATQPKATQPTPTPVVQAKAEEAKPKPNVKPVPAVAALTQAAPKKPIGTPTMTKAEIAARERDERIAKAVARVKNEGSTGGGTGKAGDQPGGGPVSVGPGSGPGGGVVKGIEYLLYYNQMMARLKDAWAWAGRGGLEAVVSFRIAENGEVSDVRITRSSGDQTYDATVMRAVRAVNPLAPPPEAYRREFSEVEITFSPSSMNM